MRHATCIAIGSLVLAGAIEAVRAPDTARVDLGPALIAPDEQGVSVFWHLNVERAEHRVEYGDTPALGRAATLAARTRAPCVRLDGLTPGATVHYRVVSGEAASAVRSFRLPDGARPFRLAIWADNQSGAAVFARRTVPTIRALGPDLLLAAGDLVDDGADLDDWRDQLYLPARELLATVPWLPARGNHDGESALARRLCPLPGDAGHYARTFGPLRIVVLDTNVPVGRGSAQLAWLEAEVRSQAWLDARFRLVAFHHPPFTSLWDRPGYTGEAVVRDDVVPVLEAAGADLVVTGHAHAYERGDRPRPDGGRTHYVIAGGGGGDLDTVDVGVWRGSHVRSSRHHVVVVDVSGAALRLRAIDTRTGETFDRLEVLDLPRLP